MSVSSPLAEVRVVAVTVQGSFKGVHCAPPAMVTQGMPTKAPTGNQGAGNQGHGAPPARPPNAINATKATVFMVSLPDGESPMILFDFIFNCDYFVLCFFVLFRFCFACFVLC